ncbi:hypothetical protein LCGC14_0992500 [marine sediment metagenome]|uniref:Transposase IS891/IS1136/IS1341 domain-containing protein n=1 Tax=marine sediment metagenome TaxID=412755 RepID=A0A0F9N5I0_9ZZZZ
MRIYQTYRYELKPNNRQVGLLRECCGTARFAYNWGLAQQFEALRTEEKFPSANVLHKRLNQRKNEDLPWVRNVSKWIPQNALRNLDRAWRNKKLGHAQTPRFKSRRGSKDSFRVDAPVHVKGKTIQLPKLGQLRAKESTVKLQGRILSATVSREADRWFVSLSVERDRPDPTAPAGRPIGIDLGIKSFIVTSSGVDVKAPKPLKRGLRKLQRLSRQVSRKQKGSRNRRKAANRLARHHRKVRNIRQDFLHKLSSDLTKTKQIIVAEDLNIAGIVRNRKLSRAILDLGWGEFLRQLDYKAEWYGSEVIKIDRWFPSSKTCSCCGFKLKKLELGTRAWTCPGCSTELDRDLNAALNILLEGCGEELIDQYPEFQGNLRLWRSSKSGGNVSKDLGSRKQMPNGLVSFG